MALRTTYRLDRVGATPTFAAAATGDSFTCGNDTFIEVVTSGTGTIVTIPTPPTVGGLAVADIAITLAATDRKWIGPLPAWLVANSQGVGDLQYSSLVGVTLAVIQVKE